MSINSDQTTQKEAKGEIQETKTEEISRNHNAVADLNPNMSIIALNVNDLNS